MTPLDGPEDYINRRRLVIRSLLHPLVLLPTLGALLFIPAGSPDWPMGWAVPGVYLAGLGATNLLVTLRDPGLAQERAKPPVDAKKWDRILTQLANLPMLLMLPVAGLDRRYGWSPQLPWTVQLAALVGLVLALVLVGWAMTTNRFFSSLVRIQADRGHTVVSAGPYRYVRHPGYLGLIAIQLLVPLALGTVFGMAFGGVSVCLCIVRTSLEDRTLHEELHGYVEYARGVRYRLVPGVW